MLVLDVMRRANSEHEVKFLLAAYLETLPLYDVSHSLPGGVTELPVASVEDVRDRFEALLDIELSGGAERAGEHVHAIVREAAQIFGAALTRMQSLHKTIPRATAPSAALMF